MYDWDGLKCFLAVAREGSTLAASKALRVNQTTVARRIEALESQLKLKLFERGQSGSRLSDAGRALLAEAEAMEAAAAAFATKAASHHRGLGGTLRVTCSEATATFMLTPVLAEFRKAYPDVRVELAITDAMLDLEAGEADIALRGAVSPLPDSSLIARKMGVSRFAPYCSFDYARHYGLPTAETLTRHHIVGGEGDVANLPGMAALLRRSAGAEVACRSNSMTNLLLSVKSGIGIGILPLELGDSDPDLIRVYDPDQEACAPFWIISRPELKTVPYARAFIDFVASSVQSAGRKYAAAAAKVRAEVAPLIEQLAQEQSARA